jgi:hypothetical protein
MENIYYSLLVFYYLNVSKIWPDKRGDFWCERRYKRGDLWCEWPYKRGDFWCEWPYKRGDYCTTSTLVYIVYVD